MKLFEKLLPRKIEFYPFDEFAKLYPPKPAKNSLPDWYKNLDNYIPNSEYTARCLIEKDSPNSLFTMKRCIPVQDYITSGYTFFFNTEILISEVSFADTKDFLWYAPRETNTVVGSHPFNQCPVHFKDKKRNYIKFFANWGIRTPPGYSCLIEQPFYFREDRFTLFPAIVDTDTYVDPIGFVGYMNDGFNETKIDPGTPIVNIYPFKREEWKMDIKDGISHEFMNKFTTLRGQFFTNVYRKFYHSKKKYN